MDFSGEVDFNPLLDEIVNKPGVIAECYNAFHSYSFQNMILAYCQLAERGEKIQPMAAFGAWKKLGRTVKPGSKALTLLHPKKIRFPKKDDDGKPVVDKNGKTVYVEFMRGFVYKATTFPLVDTEGDDATVAPVPGFDWDKCLDTLKIRKVSFSHHDGNVQGYAVPKSREVAINPVAAHPERTLIHEIAHVLLHDGATPIVDGAVLSRSVMEMEAETVAYCVSHVFNLPGAEESRGYVQNWYRGEKLPDESAQRIIQAVSKILRAGKAGD